MHPHARESDLVVEMVDDELVVYDLTRHSAHRLNATTAFVWQHCNGRTAIPEIAALLAAEFKVPGEEGLVWLALDLLRKAELLREAPEWPPEFSPLTRRQALALGLAGMASLLLPACDTAGGLDPDLRASLSGTGVESSEDCIRGSWTSGNLSNLTACGTTADQAKAKLLEKVRDNCADNKPADVRTCRDRGPCDQPDLPACKQRSNVPSKLKIRTATETDCPGGEGFFAYIDGKNQSVSCFCRCGPI